MNKLTKNELKKLNERFGRKKKKTPKALSILNKDKYNEESTCPAQPKTKSSSDNIIALLLRNIRAQHLLAEWQKVLLAEQEILLKQLEKSSNC